MKPFKEFRIVYFFFTIIFLFDSSKEDIINNPIEICDNPNPIILSSATRYYIYTSGKYVVMDRQTGNIISTSDFMTYEKPYVLCNDESNNFYIYSKNKVNQIIPTLTSINLGNMKFPKSNQFVGYIQEKGASSNWIGKKGAKCKISKDETVIYGKSDDSIMFSFIKDKSYETISISSNMEDQMSCKIISSCQYLCGIVNNHKVYIYAIMYINKGFTTLVGCEISSIGSLQLSLLSMHTNVVFYDTNSAETKLVCAKNITSLNIECIYVKCEIEESESITSFVHTPHFYLSTSIDLSVETDSSSNGDCALASFANEILFCCGGNNLIKCTRFKNNYEYINSFFINMEGDNTYIKLFVTESYASIFFMNEFNSQSKIYQHYIFLPNCTELSYTIISHHSINEDRAGNEDCIRNIFTKKTNTNYYIEFENIPEEYGDLTLDNRKIDSNTSKILINDSYPYILDFLSTNAKSVNNHETLYTISIDETYSAQCKIDLTILPCYRSCEKCSIDDSNSDDENHNCIENNCKEGYYADPTESTNCFTIYEKKITGILII
jgi:hypothetical protein